MSRLRKFTKRKKFILVSKVAAIVYVTTFALGYLASGTGAYYNDLNENKQVIQAGTWWDGSKLEFTGKPTQNTKACPQVEITIQIKNNGFGMTDSTEYEVYLSGDKVKSGTIKPIEEGGTATLSYQTDKTGTYMFKAMQRPGYDGDYESRQEFLSKSVVVECIEEKVEEPKQVDEQENINNEETESDQSNGENQLESESEASKETKEEDTESSDNAQGEDIQEGEDKVKGESESSPIDSTDTDKIEENSEVENNKQETESKTEQKNKTTEETEID